VRNIFYRIVEFAQRRAWLIIAAVGILTIFFGWYAAHIRPDPDAIITPEDPKVTKLTEKYGAANVAGNFLIVLARGPLLYTPRALGMLYDAYEKLAAIPRAHVGITPFNFPAFQKQEGRLGFGTASKGGLPPETDEEAAAFRQRLLANPLARNLVIASGGDSLAAYFPVDNIDDYRPLLTQAEAVIAPLAPVIDVRFSGTVPLSRAILNHIYGDLPVFLGIALLIILVSFFLSFRTLRSLFLPILVVILGTVWTVGTITLMGFKLSTIMIMTPPLVLILGSSYSLHMLNQYYRDTRGLARGGKDWIVKSVTRIAITIFLASSTTVFGFISLLTASFRQAREFGAATGIGITYCALLALFFLPAVLSLLRSPTPQETDRVREGLLARFLIRMAKAIIRGRWAVVAGSVLIVAGFGVALTNIHYETDFLKYSRYREQSVENYQQLIDSFTGFEMVYFTLNAPPGSTNYFQDPGVLATVARLEDRIAADPDVKYVLSFNTFLRSMMEAMTGAAEVPQSRAPILLLSKYVSALSATPMGKTIAGNMLSSDGTRYTITVHIWDHEKRNLAFEEQMSKILPRLKAVASETLPKEIDPEFWGSVVTLLSTSRILTRNQLSSILTSAALVFLIAAIIFRSLRYGLVVLAPLTVGIMLDFILMGVLSIKLDVVTIAFASIAIGIGVDNAMHLVVWFRRQQRVHPRDPGMTIEQTMKIAGKPMILTTASIAVALLVFVFSAFRPVMYFGILIAMSLILTTLGALTILPVLLYFGARVKMRRAERRAVSARGGAR
jgi:predicted RND superfamily exporter protein